MTSSSWNQFGRRELLTHRNDVKGHHGDSIRDRSGDGLDDVRGLAAWCNVPDRPGKTFADSMVVGIDAFDVKPHVRHAKRRGAVDLPLDRRRQSTQPRLPGHAEPAVRPLIGNLSPPDRRRETEADLTPAPGPTPRSEERGVGKERQHRGALYR